MSRLLNRWLGINRRAIAPEVTLLIGVGVFDALCAVTAAAVPHWVNDLIVAAAAFSAIAVGTFIGLLLCGFVRTGGVITFDELRDAIAATFVIVYLLLVVFTAFGITTEGQAPFAQSMVTNFTVTTGIVVAFYFGSGAVSRAANRSGWAAPDSPRSSHAATVDSAPPPGAELHGHTAAHAVSERAGSRRPRGTRTTFGGDGNS